MGYKRFGYSAGSVSRFGRALKEERISKGVKQKDAAIKAGVTPSYLCRVERGDIEIPPRPEFIIRIAKAIGVDENALLVASGRDDCLKIARTKSNKELQDG